MILGIDTSLGTAVAVVESDGVVRADLDSGDARGHAEVIGTMLVDALAEAQVDPTAVTRVAVGMGPGPFTGLRVGIAAARAFALGRGIDVVPVISHDAAALEVMLAAALADAADERFAIVTDARRREFAYSVYDGIDDDGLPVRVEGPALCARDALNSTLAQLGARGIEVGRISAAMVGVVAARAVAVGRRVADDEAVYLRAPDVTPSAGPKRVGV